MVRKQILLLLAICFGHFLYAQTLSITKEFTLVPNSSVLALYKNQFGHKEKPELDDTFPYALIRVRLEGNERDVTMAKQKLGLYLGQLRAVEEVYKGIENELLFLVPSGSGHVEITCGEGCAKQTIIDEARLISNKMYYGIVHYTPAEEVQTTTQAPKRQFFKMHVTPADAFVEVTENGTKIPWRVVDGIATKVLNYGTYAYSVSANRYYTEEGQFTLSDSQNSKTVVLKPKFGWLNVSGGAETKGAYAYATHKQTGARLSLGSIPLSEKELDAGEYQVLIQQDKYKDYTAIVVVEEGKTNSLNVSLVPNFVQVTLTAQQGADILIDGTKMGTSRYSGTLELGDYMIETRLASHKSVYTQVSLSSASAGKTIALNNPIPIYGSLMIDGTPMDAVVYLDGKNVGNTPLIVNELLIGEHIVRLEKDGYDKQEKIIQIIEEREEIVTYNLEEVGIGTKEIGLSSSREYGFSVSATEQVTFSKGNLQYHPAKKQWRFAEHQTDYIGDANSNISSTYDGWIDLFGWSTAATNFGVSTSEDGNDYSSRFVDWGTNKIGNDAPNTWRTLSRDEWNYLLKNRTNASSLCGVAQVSGVNGLILLPDTWICPEGVTFKSGFYGRTGKYYYAAYQTFTAEQWSKLEAAGAVFLPAAGGRLGSNVSYVQYYGYYWSATEDGSNHAYDLYFYSDGASMGLTNRHFGLSVRLVQDL